MSLQSAARARFLALACLPGLMVAAVVGCAPHGSTTVLKKFPSRPADYPIFLAEGDVEEPYQTVATLKSPAYEDFEARERGEEYLRKRARRLGGDAVIWVKREPVVRERFGFHPTGTFRAGTRLVTSYYYTGTVIRFIRPAPTTP